MNEVLSDHPVRHSVQFGHLLVWGRGHGVKKLGSCLQNEPAQLALEVLAMEGQKEQDVN